MSNQPPVKPLSAPNKDGPFGHYVLRGKDGEGPDLKYEVRHNESPAEKAASEVEGGGPTEVAVTPEMIEAGCEVLRRHLPDAFETMAPAEARALVLELCRLPFSQG